MKRMSIFAGALVADGVRLRNNGGDGMWVVAASSVAFHDAPGVATEVTGNGAAGLAVGFGGTSVALVARDVLAFVADKEINILAFLVDVMLEVEFL